MPEASATASPVPILLCREPVEGLLRIGGWYQARLQAQGQKELGVREGKQADVAVPREGPDAPGLPWQLVTPSTNGPASNVGAV